MFCEECGAKNESGAAFCGECGHKFKVEKTTKKSEKVVEKQPEVKPKKDKKPMSKGKKVLIGFIVILVAACVGGYMYLSNMLKPENVALKYFKAYANKDVDALVDVVTIDESEFVSKKLLKESFKGTKKIKIKNYSVDDVDKQDGLTATVIIKYLEEGESGTKTKSVKLTKEKNKKWLLFDNWVVDSSELSAEKYTITAPVDSKLYINGIEVKKKYKKNSSTYSDTYVIPSILKGEYTITAELKSGIKLSGKATVNNSYGSFSYSSLKLDDETSKKIVKDAKSKVKKIYNAIIDDKSFDDIKDNFDEEYEYGFSSSYDRVKRSVMTEYNKLKEFELTDLKIKSCNVYDGNLKLTLQMKYNYTVEYKSGDDTKEISKKDQTGTFYATYKLDKKEYTMSEISNLVSYFSHYGF